MSFAQYIKLALLSIRSSKVRSFLTILGIIIGIASVVIMIGLGNGTRQTIEESFVDLGVNTITIYPQYVMPSLPMAGTPLDEAAMDLVLSDHDVELLREAPSLQGRLEYVSPEFMAGEAITVGKINDYAPTIGVQNDYAQIKSLKLKAGNFFTAQHIKSNARVTVLGANIAERLFQNQNPVGKTIRLKNQLLKIIGVLEKKGGANSYSMQDESLIIPITTAQNIIYGNKNHSSILIKAVNRDDVEAVRIEIENILAADRKEFDPNSRSFGVQSANQILDSINAVTAGFTAFMLAIASITLVVGAIGITNTMIATISERTKEIGLRKAVGARNWDIRLQFLVESTVLTLLGGIFGVLLAVGLSFLINTVLGNAQVGPIGFGQGFRVIVDVKAALLAAGVSCVVGIISGLYPAIKAARLNPIEALRYE